MNPKIITPATQVIDLARGKLQCKITGNDRNDDVTDAIAAARDYAQAFLGYPVGPQTLQYTFPTWCGAYTFPFDVTTVVSVTADGVAVDPLPTLDADGRTLTFAADAPVVIQVTCGWTIATLPATVKSAMLLLIADLVRNPQAQGEAQLYKNENVDNLLWPHRARVGL